MSSVICQVAFSKPDTIWDSMFLHFYIIIILYSCISILLSFYLLTFLSLTQELLPIVLMFEIPQNSVTAPDSTSPAIHSIAQKYNVTITFKQVRLYLPSTKALPTIDYPLLYVSYHAPPLS